MRKLFHGTAIILFTLVFGSLAILFCILIPNGNPLIWFARPWAASILTVCGTRIRVQGQEHLANLGPAVFITNHQSHFDILGLIRCLPGQYRVIAKKELFRIPVFGWALAIAGFIRIDRSNRDRAIRSLDIAARRIRSGKSVVVFAEGTRSLDGQLRPFKKGGFILAMKSGCPVVPVSISGSRAVLSKNSLDIRGGPIDVVIGEPIDTTNYDYEQRDTLIARVRAAMEAGFTELRRRDLETGTTTSPRSAVRA